MCWLMMTFHERNIELTLCVFSSFFARASIRRIQSGGLSTINASMLIHYLSDSIRRIESDGLNLVDWIFRIEYYKRVYALTLSVRSNPPDSIRRIEYYKRVFIYLRVLPIRRIESGGLNPADWSIINAALWKIQKYPKKYPRFLEIFIIFFKSKRKSAGVFNFN